MRTREDYRCSVCHLSATQIRKQLAIFAGPAAGKRGVIGRCAKCGKDFCVIHGFKHLSEGPCKSLEAKDLL